jgi:hypothetical protein
VLYGRQITKADTTERFVSKTGVLGCGFGCGWKKFKSQVRSKGGLEISDELSKRTITVYREVNSKIVGCWDTCESLLGHEKTFACLRSFGDSILLPNNLSLHYPSLRYESYTTRAGDRKTGWRYNSREGRTAIWGGYVLENIAQALARIIATDKLVELCEEGIRVPLMAHDELVACVPESMADLTKTYMEDMMSEPMGWYEDLPLAAEVKIGYTYGEAK